MGKLILKLVPAETLAKFIAELVTKALSKIKDKDKLAKISSAVSSTGKAVEITAEAVKDGEVSEAEINEVSKSITTAVVDIIEAAK